MSSDVKPDELGWIYGVVGAIIGAGATALGMTWMQNMQKQQAARGQQEFYDDTQPGKTFKQPPQSRRATNQKKKPIIDDVDEKQEEAPVEGESFAYDGSKTNKSDGVSFGIPGAV